MDLTITEKYALCMLKEKEKFYESELTPYLLTSMILEMMLDGSLEVVDKNIKLIDKIPKDNYNIQLYYAIKERKFAGILKKADISFRDIITLVCYSFSNKTMKSIIEPLKVKMIEDQLIHVEMKKALFGKKEIIVVNDDKFNCVVEEIRNEILEHDDLSDDIILLSLLLNATKFLKNIFTKYEKEKLDERLKEIQKSEISSKVKIAQEVIDDMSVVMAAVLFTTMNT